MIDKKLLVILACPVSNGPLIEVGDELWCTRYLPVQIAYTRR